MSGILLYSKKAGDRSSWAAVRGSKEVWISGMVGGDRVDIEYKDADGEIITDEVCAEGTGIVEDDKVLVIAEDTEFIRATHIDAGIGTNVCVDMTR